MRAIPPNRGRHDTQCTQSVIPHTTGDGTPRCTTRNRGRPVHEHDSPPTTGDATGAHKFPLSVNALYIRSAIDCTNSEGGDRPRLMGPSHTHTHTRIMKQPCFHFESSDSCKLPVSFNQGVYHSTQQCVLLPRLATSTINNRDRNVNEQVQRRALQRVPRTLYWPYCFVGIGRHASSANQLFEEREREKDIEINKQRGWRGRNRDKLLNFLKWFLPKFIEVQVQYSII